MSDENESIGFGLHDAHLTSIVLDWTLGEGRMEFAAHSPRRTSVHISFSGLRDVQLPRKSPWGIAPHAFTVNDVTYAAASEAACAEIEIEMSSGDVLRVVAGAFERTELPRND